MLNAVNLYFRDRVTRHRGKQHAAKRVTESLAETALHGLERDLGAERVLKLYVDGAAWNEKTVNRCGCHLNLLKTTILSRTRQ